MYGLFSWMILYPLVACLCIAEANNAGAVPKNVILLIADGCGFNHVEAASLYQHGAPGQLIFESFPVHLAMSTSQYGGRYDPVLAWSDFLYVTRDYTDSAAAATALSTGRKTVRLALGVDAAGRPLLHALEVAERRGKATGVVTTVPWSHATPAGFVVHNATRGDYPEIAAKMVEHSAVDVIMGAGHPLYDDNGLPRAATPSFEYVGGPAVWQRLHAQVATSDADGDSVPDPWTLIETREAFQALATGPTPRRVLGTAQVAQTLQQWRSGTSIVPYDVPFIPNVPTLSEMVQAALNILDDDPDGLFLMVEGGAVDWASHFNQSARMVEEMLDFADAVETVVTWVEMRSTWDETLVIVTSDHECGYLAGPGSNPEWKPLRNRGAGNLPDMEWYYWSHTNTPVPLYAKGAGAARLLPYATGHDPVRGPYLDNTHVGRVVHELLGMPIASPAGVLRVR